VVDNSALSNPPASLRLRPANRADLAQIALVFLSAFPQSVEHYSGRQPERVWRAGQLIWPGGGRLMADVFAICLHCEATAFIVAEDEAQGRIAGYIFAPAHASRLLRIQLTGASLLKIAWNWSNRRYSIGPRAYAIAWHNLRTMLLEARQERGTELLCDARVFSIAVHPDYQGLGLGKALTAAGLDYLRGCGERRVRLEVRPDNAAAVRVYEKLGFVVKGQTADSQGPWLIMLTEFNS
jgi:[ribosomal protein S18]-alanine N-acetyltransferase